MCLSFLKCLSVFFLAASGWVKMASHAGVVVVCLEDLALLSVHVLRSKERQQQGEVSREAWQPTSSSRDSPWQLVNEGCC